MPPRHHRLLQLIQLLVACRELKVGNKSLGMRLGEELEGHLDLRVVYVIVDQSVMACLGNSKHQIDPFVQMAGLFKLFPHHVDEGVGRCCPGREAYITYLISLFIKSKICIPHVDQKLPVSVKELGNQFFEVFVYC